MLESLVLAALAHAEPGSIGGRVLDGAGAPGAGAAVIVTDAATGVPVRRATWAPFTDGPGDTEAAMADIAFAVTGEDGSFSFGAVEPGEYRLLAQSWVGEPDPPGALEVNAKVVHVRGAAMVELKPGEVERIEMRPLGSATLVLGDHAGNNETLVVVSTAPLRTDPILGFGGWVGPFLQSMAGFNRMPDGETIFRGLPEGEAHVAVFSADNIAGCGGATVTLDDDQPMWVKMPFVVSWSDGVHSPPPRLEELTKAIAELPPEERAALRERYAPELPPDLTAERLLATASKFRSEQVELPGGQRAAAIDVTTAIAYAALRGRLEKAGRPLNPYRAAEVRPARAEEADAQVDEGG
ncbi:MAG: hypothetical protein ACF8R7_04005 [Phycisphaerales bacterium JB039]